MNPNIGAVHGSTAAGQVDADALRLAVLKSERARIIGVLVALAVLATATVLRDVAAGFFRHVVLLVPFFMITATFEVAMLAVVNRAIRDNRDLSPVLRMIHVLFETQMPTAAIVLMGQITALGPHGALVTPALLAYFLFILLSALRLDPTLCVLTGAFSALGYAAATALAFASSQLAPVSVLPLALYGSHALLLLGGGAVAAFVAKRVLEYLAAALREVELRRKMDKIHNELEIARDIQQGLLPKRALEAGGFQVSGWNQPADQTGGDYFDWQELPDGKLAITIADVTGHGIAPALIMAVCRAYARASFPVDGGLAAVMNRLNKFLVADLPQERFVTLAAGLLNPADGTIEILSAGHGPLLLYEAATKAVRQLEPQGIPLGLLSVIQYQNAVRIQMMPGDMLVMLTDGFLEWENRSGEDFGVDRVTRFLSARCEAPPAELIEGLYAELMVFAAGTPQADDLTALVVKRSASA